MELGTHVVVSAQDVSVEGVRLRGMKGIVVDRPRPNDPNTGLTKDRRFVRFPETHKRGEFFAWLRIHELEPIAAPA